MAELEDPSGLGRVVEDAGVVRIVEERDATESERQIRLVNLGLYAFRLSEIRDTIGDSPRRIRAASYLTDVLETIGRRSRAVLTGSRTRRRRTSSTTAPSLRGPRRSSGAASWTPT